jgi:hypothetical protein
LLSIAGAVDWQYNIGANLKSGYMQVLSTGGMLETKVLENQEYSLE